MERLFVYGSLAKGNKNARILEEIGGSWRPAFIKGLLVDRGWGAEMGYPGLILAEQGPKVQGYLFSSPDLKNHWGRLDDFEGAEYKRINTHVFVDEERLDAFVYVLRE